MQSFLTCLTMKAFFVCVFWSPPPEILEGLVENAAVGMYPAHDGFLLSAGDKS